MLKQLLENTGLILVLAVIIALLYHFPCTSLKPWIPFFLIITMTVSTLSISTSKLNPLQNKKSLSIAIFLNYFVQGLVLLIPAFLFVKNPDYLTGFIVVAAAPVAIAVVPFAYLLKGNVQIAAIGDAVIHFLAVLLMPAILLLFFAQTINPIELLFTIALLIFVPLIISRILRKMNVKEWRYSKIAINLSIGIIIYTLIALNNSIITNFSQFPIEVALILFFKIFVFGTIIFFVLKKFFSKEDAISYTLFANFKNNGLAATIALLLFSNASTIPMAFSALFDAFLIIYFEHLFKKFN